MKLVLVEIEDLASHGITLPPNMQGLTDDQIEELKLKDEWAEKCEPSGGHMWKKDEVGRRNGRGTCECAGVTEEFFFFSTGSGQSFSENASLSKKKKKSRELFTCSSK